MKHKLLAITGVVLLLILYLYGLGRMGLYSDDEPRYASIGREMALSGDYVTPRLWGQGWFEKPPLLYWMVAAGFRMGLSNDLAPRVPVALLSVAFLIAFFAMLRREFGPTAAACSTLILATSAMWVAYSQIAVTDIPMAAMFGMALLFLLPWLRTGDYRYLNGVALALGLAVLAKSTPPVILSLPALWFGRDKWRDWFRTRPMLLFLVISTLWYIVCGLRNGPAFWQVIFVQQQLQRFFSPALQHVQPWWYYFAWLPAALFPWTPLLALLVRRSLYSDKRIRFLAVTAAWTLVFFSASTNKLPGYLLPLVPPFAIVAGVALEKAGPPARVLAGLCALACCAFPVLATRLPGAMSRDPHAVAPALPIALAVIMGIGAVTAFFLRNRAVSMSLVSLLAATGYLWIKAETFPFIDIAATARPIARKIRSNGVAACVKPDVPRGLRYGLNYYTGIPLPDCGTNPTPQIVYYRDHRLIAGPP